MLELWTANVVFQAKANLHFAMELEPSPQLLVDGNNIQYTDLFDF
jgi:hypothetical protein